MGMCRTVWGFVRVDFSRWKSDRRIWVIFIITGMMLADALWGIRAYGVDYEKNCTGYLLPIIFNGGSISIGSLKIMLYIGLLLLLCDAPFIYQITPYMITRGRRGCWWKGECLYILLTSVLYALFIMLFSMVLVFPIITFGTEWGDVLHDFSFGVEATRLYEYHVNISKNVIGFLYPLPAQIYTFATVCVSFFVLGLLQYLVSLLSKSMVLGTLASGIIIFIDPVFSSFTKDVRFRWSKCLSPVSWTSINNLEVVEHGNVLTISYVLLMFSLLIVVLLAGIWWASKKVMIEVRGEV